MATYPLPNLAPNPIGTISEPSGSSITPEEWTKLLGIASTMLNRPQERQQAVLIPAMAPSPLIPLLQAH